MCRNNGKPLVIVVSAPSGAGKTTLCDRLLALRQDVAYSVSCTTRRPRGREQDGVDYFFISAEEFKRRIAAGLFLEYAEVHGHLYGTLRKTVEEALRNGRSVLMDIDVQGAAQIRGDLQRAPDDDIVKSGFVDIFIAPPSMQALRDRLEARREDRLEVIQQRLENAQGEMRRSGEYRYVIVNDSLEQALVELLAVLDGEAGKHG